MKQKKVSILLFISFLYVNSVFAQYLLNPSFEGPVGQRITPPEWQICKELSTPDTQPGAYFVNLPAHEGETYLSLVTRGPRIPFNAVQNTTEAVQAPLLIPLEEGLCYNMTVHLAFDPKFDNLTDKFDKPIRLNIWGGVDDCSFDQLFGASPEISNTSWESFSFEIRPDKRLNWIILEAQYVGNNTYDGSILIDNITFDRYNAQLGEDENICSDESIVLQPDFNNLTDILWSTGETTTEILVDEAGTFWFAAESNGCSVSDTIEINKLKLDIGEDQFICGDEPLRLNAITSENIQLEWNNGENTKEITISEPGIYWANATNSPCLLSDTVSIDKRELKFGKPDLALCVGDSIYLKPSTQNINNYTWNTGSSTDSLFVNTPGDYWVFTDINGCFLSDTITITQPSLDLGNNLFICENESILLSPENNQIVNWSTGEETSEIIINSTGLYWAEANVEGCFLTDTVEILLKDNCCLLQVPNAFTPNDDGINDVFEIIGNKDDFSFFEIKIYNKWGELIYNTQEFEEFWNGKTNKSYKSSSVFYWMIEYSCQIETTSNEASKIRQLKGYVSLVK